MKSLQRVAVYIDGFNLYFGLKAKKWRKYYWLDLKRFARSLLKPNQTLAEVKYFSARISGPADKQRRQSVFLEANQRLETCQMYFGLTRKSPGTARGAAKTTRFRTRR